MWTDKPSQETEGPCWGLTPSKKTGQLQAIPTWYIPADRLLSWFGSRMETAIKAYKP